MPGSNVTHYVAVVGEGTLWPGTESGQLPPSALAIGAKPSNPPIKVWPRILLVEWPDSDVDWTEPKDISVERFLQWFQDQETAPHTDHGDFILYLGDDLEVHELPLDTEPSEVRKLLLGDDADK